MKPVDQWNDWFGFWSLNDGHKCLIRRRTVLERGMWPHRLRHQSGVTGCEELIIVGQIRLQSPVCPGGNHKTFLLASLGGANQTWQEVQPSAFADTCLAGCSGQECAAETRWARPHQLLPGARLTPSRGDFMPQITAVTLPSPLHLLQAPGFSMDFQSHLWAEQPNIISAEWEGIWNLPSLTFSLFTWENGGGGMSPSSLKVGPGTQTSWFPATEQFCLQCPVQALAQWSWTLVYPMVSWMSDRKSADFQRFLFRWPEVEPENQHLSTSIPRQFRWTTFEKLRFKGIFYLILSTSFYRCTNRRSGKVGHIAI